MPHALLAIHPEARAEVLATLAYYDALDRVQGTTLSDALREHIEHAYVQIGEAPSAFPPYLFGTRRFLLRRFPYALVFDVEPSPLLLAFAHAKRRPGYWKTRRSA
jgi:hypothetical protein